MDTELAATQERQRLKMLEKQIEDMLLSNDYQTLVKELDYRCKYSTQEKLEMIRILHNIIKTGLYDKKKLLQKVINHYAIEHDNMLVFEALAVTTNIFQVHSGQEQKVIRYRFDYSAGGTYLSIV